MMPSVKQRPECRGQRLGGADSPNFAWLRRHPNRLEERGDEWEEIFQSVARGNHNEDAKRGLLEVLLELQILIDGNENFEAVGGCAPQQFAIS
jgi:hypothetical protein